MENLIRIYKRGDYNIIPFLVFNEMILSLMKLKTDQIDMKMTMNLSGKLLLAGILAFSIHGAFAQNNPGRKIGYVKVSPDSSLVDAVRKAREMRRLGQADSVR